jgi:YbbR domain-containing protein
MFDSILRNWPLKLLALLLAFAIWVAVTGEARIVQDFRVPVDVELPEHLVPAESPPSTVGVRLRGPESLFRRIDSLPFEVRVDLHDAGPGPRNVLLTPDVVSGLPNGIEVASIEPDRFRVVLERRSRKTLPVVAAFSGQPPRGFAVYDVRISPETLEVEGPETSLATLTRLRTDPIHLEGKTAPFEEVVAAVPTRLEVRVVDPKPLAVRVELDAAPESRTFPAVPVVAVGQNRPIHATPTHLAVTLAGPPALLRALRDDQLRAVADAAALPARTEPYQIPVRVEFLDLAGWQLSRITVKSVDRPRVSVLVGGPRSQATTP